MPGYTQNRDPLGPRSLRTQNFMNPEDLWQPLYDRGNYGAAGQASVSFFTIPVGGTSTLIQAGAAGAAIVKTKQHTNLETAGVIPTKMFQFVGISMAFIHEDEGEVANPTDRDRLRSGGYLLFKVGDKEILCAPLLLIPELNPNIIGSTTANATTLIGAAGGGGAGTGMYPFEVPIRLEPNQNFNATMYWGGTVTTTKDVDILLVLHGFMRRPT